MNTQKSLSLQLLTECPLLDARASTPRVLEIRLAAPSGAVPGKRHPLNLSLVLDRSGSMQGEKLEYVKQAAEHVLKLLNESDRISVVTYDDTISILAESDHLTPQFKAELIRRIRAVKTGGATNLSGGWLAGCQQVAEHPSNDTGQIDRTLLLTDGLANRGITGVEELGVHARNLAERGVSTSTFGVGEDYNEQLLEVMANNGEGHYYYIVSPLDIPDKFAQEFNELMDISARDVEVDLTLPEAVGMTLLGNWRSEKTGQGTIRIMPGSLCSSQEKSIYLDLVFPPGDEKRQVTLGVTVRGRAENGEILESKGELTFTYAGPQDIREDNVDQALLRRAAQARVSYETTQSLEMERKGMADQAADRLHKVLQQNKDHLGEADWQIYERMEKQMRGGMSEASRKQSHYYAYLTGTQRRDQHFEDRTHLLTSSADLLQQLLHDGIARVQPSPLLRQAPDALPGSLTFDRVEGMLLGLATGDSLGNTTESMLPAARRAAYGEVRDYLANRKAGDRPVGLPSDDTQMAFWTVEVLLQEGRLDPDILASRFTQEEIFGIGSTVKEFIRFYKDQKRGWRLSGQESAGNGAVMRIAPVLLPHLRKPSPGLWADAILAGMLTHNDYASNAACAAMAGMLWELLGMNAAPPQEWWGETFYRLAAPLEGNTTYTSRMPGVSYRGPAAQFVRQEVERALHSNWTTLQAGETWGSGAYLLETLPNALYILTRFGDDPEQAIIRAANDTKDNDTIAAIVGAMVG
ncbi:MAG: ADP-ribosylglycohydrolase family protein, partial [Omnitrophica WOR_2 bacterium]